MAVAGLVVIVAGCVTPPGSDPEARVEPRPLGEELPAYHAPNDVKIRPAYPPSVEEPTGGLTLPRALALALANNPELAAFSWEVRAADARTLQASLWANPRLDVELENLGGAGKFAGYRGAETTVGFSQLIFTGGKLKKRTRAARMGAELAQWDYETARVDVFTRVAKAFIRVRATQDRLVAAEQTLGLAQEVFDTISTQVASGAVSPIEEDRARVELSTRLIDRKRAERALAAARQVLVATWGSNTARFTTVEGGIGDLTPPPPYEALDQLVRRNPDVARWAAEMEKRRAELALAKAGVYPDVTVGAGVRYFNETDGTAAVVAFSVPLPVFDRNQGRVRAALANIDKAEQQRRSVEVAVRSSLRQAYERLRAAYQEATTLREVTLPSARSAFDGMSRGYREGKFDYMNVLDAQRTLFATRFRYIGAQADYHITRADVERLIAQPLPEVNRDPL